MEMLSPVDTIKGVGEKTAKYFNKLGVYTIEDILLFFPRTYLMYPNTTKVNTDLVDSLISIEGRVKSSPKAFYSRNKKEILSLTVYVDTIPVDLVWFNANYF